MTTTTIHDLVEVGTPDAAAAVKLAFGSFPSGVAALAAEVDGVRVGMVSSSFSVGVSFDPPMVMFSVQNSSTTWPILKQAGRIGISILGSAHDEACYQLSSRSRDRFAGLDLHEPESGAIFVNDATVWLECVVRSEIPAGDHHVVVLEVTSLRVGDQTEPLVYHGTRFRRLIAV
ncbi:flavin reductase (DIM6/NTAB) family NADH-FMN oxidoreductase RutF [Frondihabitans sp. PhB188]|uniref:flavin reductase family protein n=1 Tax=Frondihabitans sp. PhB188 TaxID=2485200 RepID=UPI000F4A5A66|nr:flavin reductase family protein [Frondihabitans sp. PhB188]ROQ39998.1 flavin reductase (DIM6/NTAB) family NADH-FMN oxidoreductase RutF [Frondihabitans sp. PhB188]